MRVYKGYNEMISYSLTSKAEWKAFDRARLTYKNILWDPTSTDWPAQDWESFYCNRLVFKPIIANQAGPDL